MSKKATKKKHTPLPSDVLDVTFRVTLRGLVQVEMTREALARLKKQHPSLDMPADLAPLDWTSLLDALDGDAEVEEVFDGNGEGEFIEP